MGWTIDNSYAAKSKSAYPIAAFHVEISSERLETLRIFETFRQYFMSPKAGEKKQEKWDLEKQSLLHINIAPKLESELDFLILTTFTHHFLRKDSLSNCEQDKGCFTNQRLMAISLCIFSERESLMTSYPKAFDFRIWSPEGQILPFFCWALCE